MKSVLLTEQELQVAAQALDFAVRAQGIQFASAALAVFTKLQQAQDVPEASDAPVDPAD